MDLSSALPALLPRAINWAEAQAAEALASGSPLDAQALENARRVGVANPERIRVKIVDALPSPDEPVLRAAAEQAGLLGPGMIGLTLGYAIFIVDGAQGPRALSHELRHVHQYERHGGIAGFLPVYLAEIVSQGYSGSRFEADARAHEAAP